MSGCSVAGQLAPTIHEDFYCIRIYSTATSLTVGRLAASLWKFAQPSFEKPSLRFLLCEVEGPFVGSSGFRGLTQSTEEIGSCCVCKMIVP